MGFTGPSHGIPKLLPIIEDDPYAELIILDDENNSFNANKEFWPLALKENNRLQSSQPRQASKCYRKL